MLFDKSFTFKLLQIYVLTIFKLFGPLKVFLFFLLNEYFFLQINFLNSKHTFKSLKRIFKQTLRI
jgi:hypothetical protein